MRTLKTQTLSATAFAAYGAALGGQSFSPPAGVPFVVVVALGDPAFQGKQPLESSLAAFWLDGA